MPAFLRAFFGGFAREDPQSVRVSGNGTGFVSQINIPSHLRAYKVSVLGIGFVSQFRFAQKEQALRRALVHAVQAGLIAVDEADGLLIIEDEASGERAVGAWRSERNAACLRP